MISNEDSVLFLSYDMQVMNVPSLEEHLAFPQTHVYLTWKVLRQFWEICLPKLCAKVKRNRQHK